jgi:hypothetical protein
MPLEIPPSTAPTARVAGRAAGLSAAFPVVHSNGWNPSKPRLLYLRFSLLDDALRLFNEVPQKNVVCWTAVFFS